MRLEEQLTGDVALIHKLTVDAFGLARRIQFLAGLFNEPHENVVAEMADAANHLWALTNVKKDTAGEVYNRVELRLLAVATESYPHGEAIAYSAHVLGVMTGAADWRKVKTGKPFCAELLGKSWNDIAPKLAALTPDEGLLNAMRRQIAKATVSTPDNGRQTDSDWAIPVTVREVSQLTGLSVSLLNRELSIRPEPIGKRGRESVYPYAAWHGALVEAGKNPASLLSHSDVKKILRRGE